MEIFLSDKCPKAIKKIYFNFIVWQFFKEYEGSMGRNVEIVSSAIEILDLAQHLQLNLMEAVRLKGDVYTPNLNSYIKQLKMMHNTMTKTSSFYTWSGSPKRLPDLFLWYHVNFNEYETHEKMLEATANELRKIITLIKTDEEYWKDLGADNALTFIAADTLALIKILDKCIV